MNGRTRQELKRFLERLYAAHTRREAAYPDPVVFLHRYPDLRDREVAGLLAAALAYGRVAQIHASVERLLRGMGPSPHRFVIQATARDIAAVTRSFQHRWTRGPQIAQLLTRMQRMVRLDGSIEAGFAKGFEPDHETVIPALGVFVDSLRGDEPALRGLVPHPRDGSACKRMNLFLRWMVRKDEIDPGGWTAIPASRLVVPLDVHMHRAARRMKLTRRNQADLRAALEVTAAFRRICPEDPVRYDFALTRRGMAGEPVT